MARWSTVPAIANRADRVQSAPAEPSRARGGGATVRGSAPAYSPNVRSRCVRRWPLLSAPLSAALPPAHCIPTACVRSTQPALGDPAVGPQRSVLQRCARRHTAPRRAAAFPTSTDTAGCTASTVRHTHEEALQAPCAALLHPRLLPPPALSRTRAMDRRSAAAQQRSSAVQLRSVSPLLRSPPLTPIDPSNTVHSSLSSHAVPLIACPRSSIPVPRSIAGVCGPTCALDVRAAEMEMDMVDEDVNAAHNPA